MKRTYRKYTPLSTEPLQITLESRLLSGSIISGNSIIAPARQEKGIEVDMQDSGFNHDWE